MTRSPSLDEFANIYRHGFARVAACTLPTALADPLEAAQRHVEQVQECHAEGVALAVFPELSLTGYSIDDLLLQDVLLRDVEAALAELAAATSGLRPVIVVGAPGSSAAAVARPERPSPRTAMVWSATPWTGIMSAMSLLRPSPLAKASSWRQ